MIYELHFISSNRVLKFHFQYLIPTKEFVKQGFLYAVYTLIYLHGWEHIKYFILYLEKRNQLSLLPSVIKAVVNYFFKFNLSLFHIMIFLASKIQARVYRG